MPGPTSSPRHRMPPASGSALIFALALILAVTIVGVLIVRYAGQDRVDAAKMGVSDRGLACAEAGLQYARKFFGSHYDTSHGWNDYLSGTTPGYRYDPANFPGVDVEPTSFSSMPKQVLGYSDGSTLDPGADLSGNGQSVFWVSIRDDDDERPLGIADNPSRDNNLTIIIRSECTNPAWAIQRGGVPTNAVLESVLTYIQGSSGYATSERTANASDLVGGHP